MSLHRENHQTLWSTQNGNRRPHRAGLRVPYDVMQGMQQLLSLPFECTCTDCTNQSNSGLSVCLVQWCTHCLFSPQNAQFNSYSVNHTSLGWESHFTPRRPLVMRLLFKAVRIYLNAVEVYSYVGTFRTITCWRW